MRTCKFCDLDHQMKENAATAELNQTLAKEQASLQKEIHKLQLIIEEERSDKEKRKAQISDVIRRVLFIPSVVYSLLLLCC